MKYLLASDCNGSGSTVEWLNAELHVLKSYNTDDGSIKDEDREQAFDNVRLQLEAASWAKKFNKIDFRSDLRKHKEIRVLPCTAIELVSRPYKPVVCCEPYLLHADSEPFLIFGSDTFNSGPAADDPVPLAFFLFSLYASGGTSMIVHMEGTESVFTNPQVSIVRKCLSFSVTCLNSSNLF